MPPTLHALSIVSLDPARSARFWCDLLGWDMAADGVTLRPTDDTGFGLRFEPSDDPKVGPKVGPNLVHLHLTSASSDDQAHTVTRALELGGRHLDVGQRPEEGHVVLADPEGNELCVIEPGSTFLAGCGFLGEVACDGSREVGLFWSEALGWPLVWDQDEETAIRSPHGGPKVAWGGPPLMDRLGPDRIRLELAVEGDAEVEVARLVSLGAARRDEPTTSGGRIAMADPDGHDFWVAHALPSPR